MSVAPEVPEASEAWPFGPTEATRSVVEVEGAALEVFEAGRGGRPLLLVHGFTGAKEDFHDWYDAFAAEGWWVVAPDLRGHGASHQPAEESAYSLDIYAAELLALVDVLGWDRFALLGHSMGGMIVQEMALLAPERIERLVLMDTNHGPVSGLDPEVVAAGIGIVRTQGLAALAELLAAFPSERPPADQRVRDTRAGYVAWNEGKYLRCSPAMYAAMGSMVASRPDRLDAVRAISVPTRVVVGEQDKAFREASRRLSEAIAGADLVVIPDAAHSPQFENPQGWWDAVADFLAADPPA